MRSEEFLSELMRGEFTSDDHLNKEINDLWSEYEPFLGHLNHSDFSKLNGFEIVRIPKEQNSAYFFILNNQAPVGYLYTTKSRYNSDWTRIREAAILPKYRGQGIMKALYRKLIERTPIVSDIEQTESAERLWRSFYPEYNVYLYNTATGEIRKVKDEKEIDLAYPPIEQYTNLIVSKGELK